MNNDENPWETKEGKVVWKTEAQYWNWLRGGLRKLWSDYPLRKVWKQSQLRPVTEQERIDKIFHPSTKNVGQCVFCKSWMAGSKLESDHIVVSDGCTDKRTAELFLWHCGGQTGSNFQLACKPCHKIKSYSEKRGISFEEAAIEKKAIEWEKQNKGVQVQRDLLSSLGVENAQFLKTKDIRKAYINYLKSSCDN